MAYSTVQEEGSNLTQRSTLNFIGDVVTATDNSGSARTDVTLAAVKLQTSSPGTAQTGNVNIDTGVGRLAVQDKGGQVFNVKAYGAKGDGTTDDTTAISNAMTAAATVAGQVLFPNGIFKTTGDFDLSGKDGITIRGSGIHSTTIDLAHASNDLFKFGSGATPANLLDVDISDFSVTSVSTTRTAGWILRGLASVNPDGGKGYLRRSRIERIDIKRQVNGIWLNRFEMVWLTDLMMSNFVGTGGIGLKAGQTVTAPASENQGADLRITGCSITGLDLVENDPVALSVGYWIEDCEAVVATGSGSLATIDHGAKMVAGGHGLFNHFFTEFSTDLTQNSHGVYVTGTGPVTRVQFNGGWFGSSGALTPAVTNATNASPIVITTSSPHRFSTGNSVRISGVGGNTAANGDWTITVTSSTQFSLSGSSGNGAYTSGGSARLVSSAGANGVRIDAETASHIEFTGVRFIANQGSGLFLVNSTELPCAVTGCDFNQNGAGGVSNNKSGIYVDIGGGYYGPVIVGNVFAGNVGACIQTVGGKRVTFIGNQIDNAPAWGTDPDVNVCNDYEGGRCHALVYRSTHNQSATGPMSRSRSTRKHRTRRVCTVEPGVG